MCCCAGLMDEVNLLVGGGEVPGGRLLGGLRATCHVLQGRGVRTLHEGVWRDSLPS